MGMYTEIYVNVDLKKDLPPDVLAILKAMCGDEDVNALKGKPSRWGYMFYSGSYYTPNVSCRVLEYDDISNQWSLLGKGDIKNYEQEIEKFFEWIDPYVDAESGEFIGYKRYEENLNPTLIWKK